MYITTVLLTSMILSLFIAVSTFIPNTNVNAMSGQRMYATADWDSSLGNGVYAPQNQGAYTNLYIAPGSCSDWLSGGHINQTLWEVTDNCTSVGTYWVEGGYTYGYQGSNVLAYYWAHGSETYGYADHLITSTTPTVGSWEPIQIKYTNNNTWTVYYNWSVQSGPYGQSVATGNKSWSRGMVAGLGSTSAGSTLSGAQATAFEWMDSSETWHSGWDNSGINSFLYANPGTHVSWNTQYQSITDGL